MSAVADRVALVTGGSRGIGRECCLTLASAGFHVVVAAKSTESTASLPGSIYTVAEEIRVLNPNVKVLPIRVNLLHDEDVEHCIKEVVDTFGRLDVLINNASALWWQDIQDTPMKKYDLITRLNSRATFHITKLCLPIMERNGFGRIVNMSPPIRLDGFAGHTAYNISKFGMTMVALGVSQEYQGTGVTANALWPATIIESYASKNFKLGETSMWRKASILADAVAHLVKEDDNFSGHMLVDDTYLRTKGYTDDDFIKYRFNPDVEPPRLLDTTLDPTLARTMAKRGDIRALHSDLQQSKL